MISECSLRSLSTFEMLFLLVPVSISDVPIQLINHLFFYSLPFTITLVCWNPSLTISCIPNCFQVDWTPICLQTIIGQSLGSLQLEIKVKTLRRSNTIVVDTPSASSEFMCLIIDLPQYCVLHMQSTRILNQSNCSIDWRVEFICLTSKEFCHHCGPNGTGTHPIWWVQVTAPFYTRELTNGNWRHSGRFLTRFVT